MADVFSKRKRSAVMAAIRSKGNKGTELKLIAIFRTFKITGWKRNHPLPGKPDFVFPKERLALFVDGCFWHGCPLHGHVPQSNVAYWLPKLKRNKARDRDVNRLFKKRGWKVIRFWEHSLKNPASVAQRIISVRNAQE
jgi:DNA mismatch endonuclease, patch repair protein